MRIKLELPNDDFRALNIAVDKTRSTSDTVAVPKATLAALLKDHSLLIHEFRNEIGGNL